MARHDRRRTGQRGRRHTEPTPRCPVTGQVGFRTWKLADRARNRTGAERVYSCPECGRLHITSLTASEADSLRSRVLPSRPPGDRHAAIARVVHAEASSYLDLGEIRQEATA
jgi:hypothetical protein